ncbi:hypothetical protein ACFVFS_24025 [Kitasatospora sp. NPDC057692]|uniref:hypothetical protein n=1 Tax=Kitasatospora sp. NPDC057692 TaxID=3346215 RepID=UPI003684C245
MAQHETDNQVSGSTVTGPIVQIGTASGPINIGPGPQYNDLRRNSDGSAPSYSAVESGTADSER